MLPTAGAEHLFLGGSELARLMQEFDWRTTSLGAPEGWPESLKTAVRIMLTSRQPIWIGWGEELIYLYNDPYKSIIGGKHPWALGKPTAVVWQEIWNDIGPMLARAMRGDEGTYVEEQLLIMERHGYKEETYYTFSYSPIPNPDGSAGGIICANTDDTQRVIGERQLSLLRALAADTAEARSGQQACERSARALRANPHDLPFTIIYRAEPDGKRAVVAGLSGIGLDQAHRSVSLEAPSIWAFDEVLQTQRPHLVSDLAAVLGSTVPTGAWTQPPAQAVVLPLAAGGEAGRPGFLVVGLNPFRLFDDSYAAFLKLAAGQIASAIGNAEAYEQERRRAEALAEIDRAKTTFFSNVSHEFRTPLTLMLGPLEEMLAAPGDAIASGVRPLVSVVHRNAVRLLKLVNTLLDFSRIEAGRVEASYEPVDLPALTAELASNFRSAMEKAGLRLVVDCPPLPQLVHVDRDMWEKIVLNLLSNAFKFTFDGEIAVTMGSSADGARAELSIRDTGTGIPAAELPYLFERFRRVEGARGRSFEGSGIGLALVQELVRLHGGDVRVASEMDRGTVFTVSLPFGAAHLPAGKIGTAPSRTASGLRAQAYVDEALGWLSAEGIGETPSPSEPSDLGTALPIAEAKGRRVLLADDNADMRRYVERLLRSAGFEVEAVADGAAALAAIARVKPDLVLSDVMMPKLDGFGLLAAIRGSPELRDMPIVLLSARAGEEERVVGLKAGADDYLTKPFSARELLARVQVNLQLARARGRAAALLKEEAQTLELLHRVSEAIAAELDLERVVQVVTDAATQLSGAAFGSFFYNVIDERGEAYYVYTLSGAPREAFSKFPMPRNTAVFGPTFRGEGVVRSADITKDPRYGRNPPNKGMPEGHLPVRSYLATSVISRSGEVIGGLFFGHPEPGIFTARAERLVTGIATMAAIAIDKARLYQAAQREIEARRRTEAALRESEETLEAKVVERTAELAATNEQLRAEAIERERAEEALRQAQKVEGIGQLSGGIAHDFNNLLTVIIGNLEALQRHLGDSRLDVARLGRSAENAMRGARRAEALTQRLLAFSRQQPLDPKPIDVSRLVAGMSDLLRRTLGEHVSIETVLAGGLWRAHADPNQLEVALLNLAVNARDAMPGGGGKLTIETANVYLDDRYAADQIEVLPGQYVMVAVTDSGAGMTAEVLSRAFEPFFTTKDVGHGTGLGLSQVYGFVKQSGGHVKIYSEVGEGTTVKIYLPRYHADGAPDPEGEAAPIARGAETETVLVVEDDEDVRAYTSETLRELGYDVLEAANGAAALHILASRGEVDVLFTDIGLPGGMNGRALADEACRRRRNLKVLFTTGYARNAIVHDGRLDPGVELITKPFTHAALAAKLRDIIDARVAPARVLVVAGDAPGRQLPTRSLEEAGFRLDAAASPTDAISKLRLVPGGVDAVVIGAGLPNSAGEALVRELRAIWPSLPIVLVAGDGDKHLRDAFANEPGIVVLDQPDAADALRAALRRLGIAG